MQVDVATEFLGKTDSEAVVSEGHCLQDFAYSSGYQTATSRGQCPGLVAWSKRERPEGKHCHHQCC